MLLGDKFFEEIKFTAKAVSEIVGKNVECEGVIVSDGGNIGRYSVLPEQDVDIAKSTAYGLNDLFKEIYSNNQRIVGVWHSHGGFDVFHSSDDDKHIEKTVFPLVRDFNKRFSQDRHWTIDGTKVEGWYGSFNILGNVESFEESLEDKVLSVVVNCRDELYVEEFYENERKVLELGHVSDQRSIEKEKIVKNIGNKVKYQGVLLKDYPNYAQVLEKNSLRQDILKKRMKKIKQNSLEKLTNILTGKERWFWDDRYEQFNQEYLNIRNNQGVHKQIDELQEIISNNSYLKRNHKKYFQDIKSRLKEIKYRSMFKEIRKKRIKKNKSK